VAKAFGIGVVSFTGVGGGNLATLSDAAIRVPEKETFKVQELHLPVYHALCAMLEAHFFG
jgi:D-sedoheptulose 7-phosphate isomerase